MTDISHIRMSQRDRALAQKLLSAIPSKDGIGNSHLCGILDWQWDRYWRIRNTLIAYDLLKTGRGKGGSVMLSNKPSKKGSQDDDVGSLGLSATGLDDQDQKLAEELLGKIPSDGTKIGNGYLRRRLGWEQDRYWKIRNTLIAYGRLETGKGRGGSVGIILPPEQDTEDSGRELDIYPLIKETLYEWAKEEQGFTEDRDILLAKTAHKRKGGRWTHPDFVLGGFKVLPYVHGNQIDLFSFEVKRSWADASMVYEAVAHRRFVNYAYLLVAEPNKHIDYVALQDIAYKQKIGLIIAEDPNKLDTWDERVSPERNNPDPSSLNHFIVHSVPWQFREKWRCWVQIPSDEDGSGLR